MQTQRSSATPHALVLLLLALIVACVIGAAIAYLPPDPSVTVEFPCMYPDGALP